MPIKGGAVCHSPLAHSPREAVSRRAHTDLPDELGAGAGEGPPPALTFLHLNTLRVPMERLPARSSGHAPLAQEASSSSQSNGTPLFPAFLCLKYLLTPEAGCLMLHRIALVKRGVFWFPRGEKRVGGAGGACWTSVGAEEEKQGKRGCFPPGKDLKPARSTSTRIDVVLKTLVWSS